MSTQFTNRQWRLPNEENKSKVSNYSMDFSGTGDKIQTTLTPPLADNSRSISLWFYTSNSSSHNMCGYGAASQVSGHNGFDILTYTGNYVGIHLFGTAIIAGGTYNLNAWNHYVITYDGTTLQGYLNGVAVDSNSTEVVNTLSTNNFIIGEGVYTGFNGFSGKLDGVAIFDYALTDGTGGTVNQIAALYGSSSTGIGNPMSLSPKPVAYYQLGDKSAFNGSNYLVPNIAAQEDDGDIAVSYSPYALDFDGTNDYIDCGNDSSLSFSTSFSLSVWINNWSNDGNCVAMKGDGASYGYFLFAPHPSDLNKFKVWIKTSNNWYNASNDIGFSDNTKWVNLVVCYNSIDNSLVLYSNGVSGSVTTTAGTLLTGTQNFKFGVENNTTSFYNGSISNASIWNTALTSTQVTELYNEGVPSNLNNHSAYSNLVSWWQLGSNSSFNTNWTVLDEKGSNNGNSANMGEDAIVDGVGSYANGLSSGMGGDEVIGDAPYSTANALSVNMDVEDRVTDTPS